MVFVIRDANNSSQRDVALLAVFCCVALGACSSVNTRTADGQPIRMTREAFAEYVEETFRYHNRVVNDIILASSFGDEDSAAEPALVRAEEEMAALCLPLNEMVSATIEGHEPSLWEKTLLLNQVPACEAATRRVERLIPAAF